MNTTPRTDFIAHKSYTERTYICEMTELARILETELVAMTARAEKAENKLAASKAEIENLIWNLAGCSTIAHSGKPTDYSHELARPALHDVNKLAARAEKAEERLEWLERFLQAGGTSISTVSPYTLEDHPDDTDETQFNLPFQIGISVEMENRGCYKWVEFSNGAKGIGPAIDAAKIKYAEWQNQMHKGD